MIHPNPSEARLLMLLGLTLGLFLSAPRIVAQGLRLARLCVDRMNKWRGR